MSRENNELEFDSSGALSGKIFSEVTFHELVVVGDADRPRALRDLVFERCRTSPGTFAIEGHVELTRVTLDDFDCGDAIRINTVVEPREVIVRGTVPGELSVKVEQAEATRLNEDDRWSLDIRDFAGQVGIYGVPPGRVRFDPRKQFGICVAQVTKDMWDELGISPMSYARLVAKKLIASNRTGGVLNYPNPSGRRYEQQMADIEKLREVGICV